MRTLILIACLGWAASAGAQTTFLERMALAETPDFLTRVQFATIKAAVAVQAEDPLTCCYPAGVTHATATDEQKAAAVTLSGLRSAFAKEALSVPHTVASNMAKAVVTNVAITAASTDADIEFTVNSLWTAFSKRMR